MTTTAEFVARVEDFVSGPDAQKYIAEVRNAPTRSDLADATAWAYRYARRVVSVCGAVRGGQYMDLIQAANALRREELTPSINEQVAFIRALRGNGPEADELLIDGLRDAIAHRVTRASP